MLEPSRYPTVRAHIVYVIIFWREKEGQWVTGLWKSQSVIIESFTTCIFEMHEVSNYSLQGQEAAKC